MPTKLDLVYLTPAAEDFEEIIKYHLLQVGVPSARKIAALMETSINKLRDYPLMGQTHPDILLAQHGYRKLVLTHTYVASYKIIGNTVYIYRIVNGRTNYPSLLI